MAGIKQYAIVALGSIKQFTKDYASAINVSVTIVILFANMILLIYPIGPHLSDGPMEFRARLCLAKNAADIEKLVYSSFAAQVNLYQPPNLIYRAFDGNGVNNSTSSITKSTLIDALISHQTFSMPVHVFFWILAVGSALLVLYPMFCINKPAECHDMILDLSVIPSAYAVCLCGFGILMVFGRLVESLLLKLTCAVVLATIYVKLSKFSPCSSLASYLCCYMPFSFLLGYELTTLVTVVHIVILSPATATAAGGSGITGSLDGYEGAVFYISAAAVSLIAMTAALFHHRHDPVIPFVVAIYLICLAISNISSSTLFFFNVSAAIFSLFCATLAVSWNAALAVCKLQNKEFTFF